jgi:endoglucanase
VASSYSALTACSTSLLASTRSVGLPPDWCVIGPDGASSFSQKPDGDDYGYDAFRVMWRVALDAEWFASAPALSYLHSAGGFLVSQWTEDRELAGSYTHSGEPVDGPDPTIYGGDIGAFVVDDPGGGRAIAQGVLLASLASVDGDTFFGVRGDYFEQNWVWFGLALEAGQLPDLAT